MKTLLLVMLILTACSGDEKKETSATQSDMQSTDATLIDMIITDIALSSIDMTAGNESDMAIESDSSISDMASTFDMSAQDGDMVIVDMAVQTTDMASK